MLYPLGNNVGHVIGLNGHWIGRDVFEAVPFTAAGYYSGLLPVQVSNTAIRRDELPLTLTGITGAVPSSYSGEYGIFMPHSARGLSITATYTGVNQNSNYVLTSILYFTPDNMSSAQWTLPYSYMTNKTYDFTATDGSRTSISAISQLPTDRAYYRMSVSTGGTYHVTAQWNIPSSVTTVLTDTAQMPIASAYYTVDSNLNYTHIYRWSATGLAPKG